MESEERAAPVEELTAAGPESAAPEQSGSEEPLQSGMPARESVPQANAAPAAPREMPAAPLAQFALEQQLARGRRLLDEQLRIIESVDPAVKSLADLRAQPEFGRFDRLVKSGMAISDAYKLACFDRLGRQQAAAARQAAINDARAKEHLAPLGGGQAAEDGLTNEIIRNYRQYNPKWTREQIARFHKSYMQKE